MSRAKLSAGLALFLLILLTGYFFIGKKDDSANMALEANWRNLQTQKSAVSTKASFAPVIIKTSTQVSSSTLPSKLRFLVNSLVDAIDLKVSKIVTEGGKTGYSVSYIAWNKELMAEHSRYSQLFTQNKWDMATGIRSELFSMIEAQNASYKATVKQSQIGAGIEAEIVLIQR